MVYITGDTHGDFSRFGEHLFPEQKEMTRDDFVIILGDFGGIWNQGPSHDEDKLLNYLENKPFTLCYIDGNHENFDRYYSSEFPIVDFHGGKAQMIRPHIYHLMRGYVYDFCGKKFFCMGGASSHDIQDGILNIDDYASEYEFHKVYQRMSRQNKMFRINHVSWWKEELPSQQEMDFGLKALAKHDNKVDFVLTHCLPQEIAAIFSYGQYEPDSLTMYLNTILHNGLQFNGWYCGHYHIDNDFMSKFHIRYYDFERIV